jgi:hypothetical protein
MYPLPMCEIFDLLFFLLNSIWSGNLVISLQFFKKQTTYDLLNEIFYLLEGSKNTFWEPTGQQVKNANNRSKFRKPVFIITHKIF